MTDLPLSPPGSPVRPGQDAVAKEGKRRRRPATRSLLLWTLRLLSLAGFVWGVVLEMQTSYVQSLLFTRLTAGMGFRIEPGPSPSLHVPKSGPYDERLGYTQLPSFVESLGARYYAVESQARLSSQLAEFIGEGGYALYHEKSQAGLALLDRIRTPLFESRVPERIYQSFEAIPPLLVGTLLFIEDRHLLDARHPTLNPAVEWERLALAVAGRIVGLADPRLRAGGASTLATQLEKYRHSPGGRTANAEEKLRQMMTATARAYLDGPDTTAARRGIVVAYLNSTPLGSRPGYGEVIGLGDGLWEWYGTAFAAANVILSQPAHDAAALSQKARIYRQALSLLLAQRRPSYYLTANRAALAALTQQYLGLLGTAGVIDPALYHAAEGAALRFRDDPGVRHAVQFVERKAVDASRIELLSLLHLPRLYDLDRLDLSAETTLDAAAQKRAADTLSRLGERDYIKSLGLVGFHMLGNEDPGRINYSVVLYERGLDRNYVRLQADSLNEPFDINAGAKLMLGSTAKLRTLITYLDIVTALHRRCVRLSPRELESVAAGAHDPLTRWAAQYLTTSPHRGLQAMLDAAMDRRYSANPGEAFFTGGGLHVFRNFEGSDNGKILSVVEAFRHSVNLVFIRLMRDIVTYYVAEPGGQTTRLLADPHDPARGLYLRRFADQEGRAYLNRFFDDYRGLTPNDALVRLASRTRPMPRRLAVMFRSVRPQASLEAFSDFLRNRLAGVPLDDALLAKLYASYAPDRFSLADRGFLAGVHPLELWLVDYLQRHPKATRMEVLEASAAERQAVYHWLFKTNSKRKQDVRIRILLEEEAFGHILDGWRRLGYPFGQLVPSYATAIGSSGDRPDALAELVGIILNDGVRMPTVRLERLHFAANTPYETNMVLQPPAPEQVLAPEVAATVRRALLGVVEQGTGQRARGSFVSSDSGPLPIGGKTGTGDNRFERFGRDRRLIDSRPVDRTATFVFFIGERFFGTITAYVSGVGAAEYHFTSALAVQLLRSLAPALEPLIVAPVPAFPSKRT